MKKILKPAGVFWTKKHSAHPLTLKKLQNEIFVDQKLKEIQVVLELLDSETRLRILILLSKKEFLCVGDIADTLRLSVSAVSHQLRLLRKEQLVRSKKKGKVVYYSISNELPRLVSVIFNQ